MSVRQKPNVLIITPHDLGDFLGCYDTPLMSPNIDSIGRDGVIFQNHFSTGTVCSPSRGSITTGCYPHTTGLMGLVHRGWTLDADKCPTLERILGSIGYQTHIFGFQHEHYDTSKLGYMQNHQADTQYVEDIVPLFIKWLGSRDKNTGPFLAGIGFSDVHKIKHELRFDFRRDAYQSVNSDFVRVPPWLPDIPPVREDLADFYGSIRHMDGWIGKLLDALNETGLVNNTIVIFTSDHGASFMHGKATVYDGGTKVPWLMRFPERIPAGTVVETLSSHVDIVPTLLELLEIEIPEHIQGMSMAVHAGGFENEHDQNTRDYIVAEKNYTNYYDPTRMIRTQDYKYIRKGLQTCIFDFLIPEIEQGLFDFRHPDVFNFYSSHRCTEELYDLRTDPGELNNLIDVPDCQIKLNELREILDVHLEATNDPFRNIRNDILMPENVYGPAMNWIRKDV